MDSHKIHLRSFGSVTGLTFENGGCVEVVLGWPEMARLLDAWADFERSKRKPNTKVLEALETLGRKATKSQFAILVEVPIAQRRAKITPVIVEKQLGRG